jgi:predicted HicB family RNase H-like nuclease
LEDENPKRKTRTSYTVTSRYQKKTYDRIAVLVKKGRKNELKAIAARKGKSLNALIVDAVDAATQQDT